MKHQTLSHQTLSKCTFYSNHQLSIAVFIFCWGVISDHPIIQPFGIAWTICLTIFSHPRCQKSKTTHWPRLTAWLLQCCGDTKSIHFGKPWGPRPRPEGCFGWKKPWLWKILEKFSARFMFFLRITAGMCLGTMRSILQIQKLEVSKFGNPMKRSHAEMATDMWEILGFKRALSIFPEPRHPKAFKQRWNNTFPPKVGVMITIIISFIIITNIVHPFSIPPGPFSCQKLLRSQWIRYSGLLSRCCAPHIHPTRLPQNQMSGWCIAKALRVPNGGGMI